jgi:hypothetical protein
VSVLNGWTAVSESGTRCEELREGVQACNVIGWFGCFVAQKH